MDVTIIISNYNYDYYVESAIESCLSQTVPCKIIVIDDASTDLSWKKITKYCDRGITAVLLKENSGGNARGKNVGIAMSNTPLVTCLDSDDMLLPDSIENRMPFIGGVDFVNGWSIFLKTIDSFSDLSKDSKLMNKPFKISGRCSKLLTEEPTRWTWAIEASTVLAHRKLYERFGLYDEEMRWSIDREMWWRWLSHGVRKYVLNKYVSIYRRHANQLTQNKKRKNPKTYSKLLKQRQLLRKNVTDENTIMLKGYQWKSHVEKICPQEQELVE